MSDQTMSSDKAKKKNPSSSTQDVRAPLSDYSVAVRNSLQTSLQERPYGLAAPFDMTHKLEAGQDRRDIWRISEYGRHESLKKTIRGDPFLLSTPSDKPYKLAPEHKDNWRLEDLFEPREEFLQYQTFFWRDTSTSLFEMRGAHELDQIRDASLKVPGANPSGASTPLQTQVAKKKITLSDYKNKTKIVSQEAGSAVDTKDKQSKTIGNVIEKTKASVGPYLAPPFEAASVEKIDKQSDALANDRSAATTVPITEVLTQSSRADEPLQAQDSKNVSQASGSTDKLQSSAVASAPRSQKRPYEDEVPHDSRDGTASQSSHRPMKVRRSGESTNDSQKTFPSKAIDGPAVASIGTESFVSRNSSHEPSAVEKGLMAPGWLTESRTDKSSTSLPSGKLKSSNVVRDDPILNWIPGNSSRTDNEKMPSRLPKIPTWSDSASGTGNGKSPSPNKSSSPDTLRLSATYSQTSHSSVSSTNADQAAPGPIKHATPKTRAPTDTKLRVRAESVVSDRPESKPSKQSSGSSEKIVSSASAKPATKTIKVNPGSSSFFENLKTNITAKPQSLLVRLKYGKSRVKTIQRILQMRPTPKRQLDATGNAAVSASSDTLNSNALAKPSGKRPHAADDQASSQPSAKRKKADNQENHPSPRTPIMPAALSPTTVTPANTLHRQVLTPKTDPKLPKVAAQAGTPLSNLATPIAPHSTDLVGVATAKSSERTAGGHSSEAWRIEHKKHNNIARLLKRNMQEVRHAKPDIVHDEKTLKKAACDGVDSVVCFMRAFLALGQIDRSPVALVKMWETLLPLAREVCGACQNYKPLHAIALFLNAACCSFLASVHPRVKADDYTSFQGETEYLKKILGNIAKLQQLTNESDRLLRQISLASEYPLTHTIYQDMAPGVFIKPMAASRLAYKMLEEWTKKELIAWTPSEEGLCTTLQSD